MSSICVLLATAALRVAYCSEPGVCYNRPGEPRAGVVVDWVTRIGSILNRPVEWVDVTQARAEEMLARDEIDIIGGLIFRTERAKRFYYFPHVTGQWRISLYVREDGRRRRFGAVPLDGCRRIGNVRSFPITEGILGAMERHGRVCTIREYDDVPRMEDALRAGEVDAILADGISDGRGIECVACDLSVPQYLVTGAGRWDLIEDVERAMREILEDGSFVTDCRRRNYPLDSGEPLPTFEELLWLGERIRENRPFSVDISGASPVMTGGGIRKGRICGVIGKLMDGVSWMTRLPYRAVQPLPVEKAIARFNAGEVEFWFPSRSLHAITPELVASNGWKTVLVQMPQVCCTSRRAPKRLTDVGCRVAVWKGDGMRIKGYGRQGFADRMTVCETQEDCLRAILDGRADCLVCDFSYARSMVDRMGLGDAIDIGGAEGVVFRSERPIFLGPRADPRLVSMMQRFVRNLGREELIRMRLRAEDDEWVPTLPMSEVVAWFTVAAILILLLLLGLALYGRHRLSAAYRASQSANRAKSTFIATMSHEIRTPLNAIIGFAEFLRARIGSESDRAGYVDGITRASNALLSLINDILDISKLDAGKETMIGGRTDLRALVAEMRSVFGLKFSKKGVSLSFEIPLDMPVVALREIRMRQVLFNLIGNASKFTERGGVTVAVEWIASENRLKIRVSDTGIGISPAAIGSIFSPFAQDGSVRGGKVYEGTGLGLAIVRRLVESAGGTVSVVSEVGVGTAFTVDIPGVKTVRDDPADAGPGSSAGLAPAVGIGDVRVVIVDDVKMNLTILRQHLRLAGVPVGNILAFTDADEALSALRAADAARTLVMTDMWMPGMNGEQFAAAIRGDAALKDVPIVAITADADSGKTFDIRFFSAILTKPVTGEKIRELLGSMVKMV